MRAWLFEVLDVLGGLAFAVSIILFLVGLLIRYGKKKESRNSSVTDLLHQLDNKELQDKIGLIVSMNDKNVLVTDLPVQIKIMYFRLEERYQILSKRYDELEESFMYMLGAAITAMFAFLVFRLIHFKS